MHADHTHQRSRSGVAATNLKRPQVVVSEFSFIHTFRPTGYSGGTPCSNVEPLVPENVRLRSQQPE